MPTTLTLIQLQNLINNIKQNHAVLSKGTYIFNEPWEWGAESAIKYPFLGVNLAQGQINGRVQTINFEMYFCDLVHKDTSNQWDVSSDMHKLALEIYSQLKYSLESTYDAMVNITATFDDFTEKFDDEVTGWMLKISVDQAFAWSVCDLPDSGANAGKVNIYDQHNTLWYSLNPGAMLILNNLTFITETYTVTGTTQATAHTPVAVANVSINGQSTSAYTLSGSTFTFNNALASDEVIITYAY